MSSTSSTRDSHANDNSDRSTTTPDSKCASGLKILVVDDNEGAAKLLAKLLTKLGPHEVTVAHDGPSALKRLQEIHAELVLLDIGLPGMDGFAVAQNIRALGNSIPQPRLIALTGYDRPEQLSASTAVGFEAYYVKPPSVEMLRNMLQSKVVQGNVVAQGSVVVQGNSPS